jgi:dTDP-4-amino-4,6-dideoxygalactose transaminase
MLNSGEGGFMCTNDDEYMAKAMCYAGCYEGLYSKHLLSPPASVMEAVKLNIPNFSLRMHAVTAAMLRPQIRTLDARIEVYNERYASVVKRLRAHPNLVVPDQLPEVGIVADSVQFNLIGTTPAQVEDFEARCASHGVPVEIFGAAANARNFKNWHFAPDAVDCEETLDIIQSAVDIRLPLQFEDEDLDIICEVITDSLSAALGDVHNAIPKDVPLKKRQYA